MNVNIIAFFKTLELVFYFALVSAIGYLIATTYGTSVMLYTGFSIMVAYLLVVVFLVNRSQIIEKQRQAELDKKV